MPRAKRVLNAFTAKEVTAITGLSMPMINYLRRMDFLVPAYAQEPGRRGKVRYYSYRDLVVARLIQRLRLAGVQLATIKQAVTALRNDDLWEHSGDDVPTALRWLHTDGKNVFIERHDGFLEYVRADRQSAFAFLVNLGGLAAEVRECIPAGAKRDNFSMKNHEMIEDTASPTISTG